MIIKIDPLHPEPFLIEEAVDILKSGGIIAYPTETFYGLGADACNEGAVEKLFSIKGRDFKNPVPVIIGAGEDVNQWVTAIPENAKEMMKSFWPGPLTLVFQASSAISSRLNAGTGKVGIRVSSHPIANALAKALVHPLTSTSANLSGFPECTAADEVFERIGQRLDVIVDGGSTLGGKGSTIIDVTSKPMKLLREGVIPSTRIHFLNER